MTVVTNMHKTSFIFIMVVMSCKMLPKNCVRKVKPTVQKTWQ